MAITERPSTAARVAATGTWRAWIPLCLGTLIALGLVQAARQHLRGSVEDAAFGRETQNTLATPDEARIHCLDSRDSPKCIATYDRAGRPPAVLWLGNSQLAGINRHQPGDRTASFLLHERLRDRGYYLVTYSLPNANLMEHAVVFHATSGKYDTRLLILPVFLDDIREQGIREFVAEFIADPAARRTLDLSRAGPLVGTQLLRSTVVAKKETGGDVPFVRRFEDALNERLSAVSPLWRDRGMLQGNLAYAIHHYRNRLLGIDARTKRKVDTSVYNEKMAVLDAILADARERGLKVLLYVPPYRRDIEGPYIPSDYARLKSDMAKMAARHQATFADIDNVVAGPEWGKVVDVVFGTEDFDFMHFTAAGHASHAKALDTILEKMGF